ncbi:MAG: hydantoinase/oxoprolinase family protein [Acidobacteria bacterium]|nr:hydantoinase/oxoprolinase family protein [Acidobacteriota bacterium]
MEPIRIGIDTGGTFTDFVVARGHRRNAFKIPSTPHHPAAAILAGLSRILAESSVLPSEIVHGTTVATNALLERKGARTALITTAGFEDVLEIGRQARPEIYNFFVTRAAPLIARQLRFGVTERIAPDATILTPLDAQQLETIVAQIADSKAESVAVCLLFSFANPTHEQQVAKALERLKIPISLSHKILPEYREYERTATVAINAYLVPKMSGYLHSLQSGVQSLEPGVESQKIDASLNASASTLVTRKTASDKKATPAGRRTTDSRRQTSLRVMQSNGGSVSAAVAASEPVRAILSGPAGGVVGALRVCDAAGIPNIITFDMGGTSTDVALCSGAAKTTNEATIAGLPVAVPIIDIHTVGAGGGSIARVDEAGALRVGPESAGADPGPACYGRGEAVTVTDANLLLGRFGGGGLLGGEMNLEVERARFFMAKLAAEMSRFSNTTVSVEQAALGVVKVANANMERALRVVSVERGQDPRLFALVSFGGAGGLHVCDLAEALRISRVVVPRSPGTLSALGVLLGDVVKDYSRTVMVKTALMNRRKLEREFVALEREAHKDLITEGFTKERQKLARSVAMRYVGQSFEIELAWQENFEQKFHALHQERYGYADASRQTEIVSLRLKATGVTDKPRLRRSALRQPAAPQVASIARVFLTERASRVPVYRRDDLSTGAQFSGPAIVTEYSSTTLIPAHRTVEVDAWLNLIITQ